MIPTVSKLVPGFGTPEGTRTPDLLIRRYLQTKPEGGLVNELLLLVDIIGYA